MASEEIKVGGCLEYFGKIGQGLIHKRESGFLAKIGDKHAKRKAKREAIAKMERLNRKRTKSNIGWLRFKGFSYPYSKLHV